MALPKLESSKYTTILPSTGMPIDYRPYVVKEEKILMIAMESKDQKQIVKALTDVIGACVYNVDVKKLAMFDIETLFLKLRAKSVGENVELKLKCTKCEEVHITDINLDDVTIKNAVKEECTVMLTPTVGIQLRYPSVYDLEKYDEATLATIDGVVSLITDCTEQIFTESDVYTTENEGRAEIQDFIDNLSSKQFMLLTNFLRDMPVLTHDIAFNCESCGTLNKLNLKGIQSFFM